MATLTETLAGRYATAVHQILVREFPDLRSDYLGFAVCEGVMRQAGNPDHRFELIVDDPRIANWRLVPDHLGPDRWRVQLACCKPNPSHANARREQRVNEALRAIRLED